MSDADGPLAADGPSRNEPDSPITRRESRDLLRDLAALLALPSMWVDHDPAYIATGLLGVLFGVLRLESAYARFDDPAGGPALVCWRPDGPRMPSALEPLASASPAVTTDSVTMPSGDRIACVTSVSPMLPGEDGLVLVSSRRTDFPTERELHVLRVAVTQAAVSIHTARELARERIARIAAEEALRFRNAFLASLALQLHDLAAPLAALAKRATQAHALTDETDQSQALSPVAAVSALDTNGASRPESHVSPHTSPARLSRRETEVLELLAQGLSNKEIAGVLVLSERTVERHITRLYRQIGADRRSEATAFALRHHLVDADAHIE